LRPSSTAHHKETKMKTKATTANCTRSSKSRTTVSTLVSLFLVGVITNSLPVVVVHGLEVGAECQTNDECDTGVCYIDSALADPSGLCACNSSTNEGCPDTLVCTGVDVEPKCLRPKEAICTKDSECASSYCFMTDRQSTCQCNPDTKTGCNSGETCLFLVEAGFPLCFNETEVDLPFGSECIYDDQCVSNKCFSSTEISGACACDMSEVVEGTNNDGCPSGYQCSSFNLPPSCLLPPGSSCTKDEECTANFCDTDNKCAVCNIDRNYGCFFDRSASCIANTSSDDPSTLVGSPVCGVPDGTVPPNGEGTVPPTVDDGGCDPPCGVGQECTTFDRKTPDCAGVRGSFCKADIDCASGYCFTSQTDDKLSSLSTCECNFLANVGCSKGGECLLLSSGGAPFCSNDTPSPTITVTTSSAPSVTPTLPKTPMPAKPTIVPIDNRIPTPAPTTIIPPVTEQTPPPTDPPVVDSSDAPSVAPSVAPTSTSSSAITNYGVRMTTCVIVFMTTFVQCVW